MNFNRNKIEMVAFFPYMKATICRHKETDERSCGWRVTQEVDWEMVREFYNQLCKEATEQLGIQRPQDNKTTFIFTCNEGITFFAANFYDFRMTMMSWYAHGVEVPENFRTNDQSYDRVREAVEKWQEQKKLSRNSFTRNLSCSLF